MLQLNDIVKIYTSGDGEVKALKGVSLEFRKNEFVSILGQSGCGKTTLLNIIGGLDRYTSGDLIINGKSTKTFKDSNWDAYRNHSVGFVFQSYNLIPHQTVLANVELALTLSGVSKAERRKRAKEVLEQVGLADQINKKPTQMSGGQMQRVAIARALVNNPEILLADEPTGALDTGTSVQIMDILKEVAQDRLVIMVTHNPELAEEYSTRIVRLSDGEVVSDSNPYDSSIEVEIDEVPCENNDKVESNAAPCESNDEVESDVAPCEGNDEVESNAAPCESNDEVESDVAPCEGDDESAIEPTPDEPKKDKKTAHVSEKKPKMSFFTALSLSLNNLFTKKGRTIITAFAGSIGIIGIALILSLSNGINVFINQVQEDTLSTFPLTIQKETQDMASMMGAMTSTNTSNESFDDDKIYVDDSLGTMMQAMSSTVSNDLVSFRKYLEEHRDELDDLVTDIQYTYDLDLQIYNLQHGPTKLGMANLLSNMGDQFAGLSNLMESAGGMDVMSEMLNNQELLDQQYELVDGKWPEEPNEVVIVVGKNNQISKLTLYMLGMLDQSELDKVMSDLMQNGEYDTTPIEPYDVQDFLDLQFYMLNTYDFYQKTDDKTYGNDLPVWYDVRNDIEYKSDDALLSEYITENGILLKVSGIIRPREGATSTSISGVVGYTKKLTDMLLENNANSEVINQQKNNPETNVLTGLPFERTKYTPETIDQLINKIDDATMEQFYAYMTKLILENPDFASRLDVKDKEGFMQVFFLMPKENQAQIIEGILGAAKVNNSMGLTMLTNVLSGMMGNVTVTPDNIMTLLPIMDIQHIAVLLGGVPQSEQMPMAISGIIDLAGEETMNGIYATTGESLKTMKVTEEIFLALLGSMNAEDEDFITLEESLYKFAPQTDATLESNLKLLGDAEKASPASINFYAKDFESKELIEEFIKDYNAQLPEGENELKYSDLVGSLMSSVSTIINVISYVLIAFVAISLIVSSVMIGIITNISVLERTKEIGILRAIGASKRDVSRVFNAETFIIGTASGIFGIVITIIVCVIANIILGFIPDIPNVRAILPPLGAVILILISMGLTMIAGLIPSRAAAKKDPVEALRSE